MFPIQGQGDGGLEDRLRGMILNNQTATLPVPAQSIANSHVPPHLRAASEEQQAQYFPNVASRKDTEGGASQTAVAPGKQKRPNQAQRRQMNSQMSIPIDSRPVHNVQAGRSPEYRNYPNSPPQHQGYQNQRQHPSQQYSPRYQNGYPSPHFHNGQPSPHQQQNPRTPQYQQFQQPFNAQPSQPLSHAQSRPTRSRQPLNSPHQQQHNYRPSPQGRQLYQPGGSHGRGRQFDSNQGSQDVGAQVSYLEGLLSDYVPRVGVAVEEVNEKEVFRSSIESICRDAIAALEQETGNSQFHASSVELQCFGSMKSGFATKSSDMDLALLAPKCVPDPHSPESRIPRLLEKVLLDHGYGARLLTRTRVPIIKLCEKPTKKLLADLRAARVKWDNGIEDDGDEDHERDTHQKGAVTAPKSPSLQFADTHGDETNPNHGDNSDKQVINSPTTPALVGLSEQAYQAKLAGLKQSTGQSLQDYHGLAKRLLRKLGGRDITANAPNLATQEAKILDDVCRAFIIGLEDKQLSSRLQQYSSLATIFDSRAEGKQRSLQGLWTQAEGERLAMVFADRPFTELNDRSEMEAVNAVESWSQLQNKSGEITDSAFFNRQLYMCLERLKKISSLQIMFLGQMQFEDPSAYFARTQKLQQGLRIREQQISLTTMAEIADFVVNKYIAGINNEHIQEALEPGRLRDVNREHVRLQLALDYENAVTLGSFDDKDIANVKEYINLLKTHKADNLRIDRGLLAKIKRLPDPTHVSVLKPRDPYKDKLEFPKTDIGIQCDINFSAKLAIHNTLLLRCYAASDSRVRPMILFIKHWAKVRGINTPYRGTLSSYGYVLMVLHYLTNVTQPFVCTNLQLVNNIPADSLSPSEREAVSVCKGRDVRFWRDEAAIKQLSEQGQLNHNHDPLGYLLRGFFEYFAQTGMMSTVQYRGFDWGREVLSLRTDGGILSKQDKGWTGAKTVVETSTIAAPTTSINKDGDQPKSSTKTIEETKEIRYRYLFAIEDPFELDHNVARTVTHNGIVSIRDEFRRAWRIIKNSGGTSQEGLLDPIADGERKNGLREALDVIHGPVEGDFPTSA